MGQGTTNQQGDSNMADKILFNNDQELLETLTLIEERHQPLTLESTVQKTGRGANGKPISTVKSRITGEPLADVFKGIVYCTKREYVSIYHEYVKATANKLRKEGKVAEAEEVERTGKVKTGKLPFGEWYKLNLVIENKEQYLLRYYQKLNPNYQFSEFVMHYADGEELSEELENRYWKEFAPVKKPSDGDLGTRGVKFAGITRLVVDHKVLIRKGYESREDKGKILDWDKLARESMPPNWLDAE